MNYRNSLTNTQYSNSSIGETYSYDDKSQHICNSPKVVVDNYGMNQHSTCHRDISSYKNNNTRIRQYHQTKNSNERPNNYFNQRPDSPDDIIIPEIDNLREFIKEQTERFKIELSHHEGQKSNSLSPGIHQYNDQSNYKYSKPYGSLSRQGNGCPASHSLGSIANTTSIVPGIQTLTISPSCSENQNRHPDARMSQGSMMNVKPNNNGYSYNKHYSQANGKPSPGLTRNLSHEDSFSKSPSSITNKNRNDSPNNNNDKPGTNNTQFPSPTGSSGCRNDQKKAYYKTKPHSFVTGPNPAMINPNNSTTNEYLKIDHQQSLPPQQHQYSRSTISAVRNGFSNGYQRTQNRRRIDIKDGDSAPSCRAVVSVADTGTRRVSHSGSSTTDSQDVSHSATADTPNTAEQFFTPDPSASPCSTRSSPDTAASNSFPLPRDHNKPVASITVSAKLGTNNHD